MGNSGTSLLDRLSDGDSSGVCWGAVIGGAFVTAALSLILLALGAGFGLTAVSPWSNVGMSAAAAGTVALVWIVVTQAISSAMGGYLAGRLRTRWTSIHIDEVHFRDTASGFLAWAVALVITVAFLTSAAASMAGGRATAASSRNGGEFDHEAYFVDRLFRSDHPASEDAAARAEAGRIVAHVLRVESASGDEARLAQLVVSRTGLNRADAEKRVSDTLADARQAEDAARKVGARVLLWIFLALLIGAFCASYAATIGGRQRDHVKAVVR